MIGRPSGWELGSIVHLKLLPALLVCSALASAAPPLDHEAPLRDAVWGGRWLEGIRLYDELASGGAAPSPRASYLAGLAEWRLRRPEDARPLLKKAADAGFRAGGGRPQPDELLARIDAYLKLRPARVDVPALDASVLDVYSDTPLAASPVLQALPRFAGLGRRIFGEPPPIRFFFFTRLAPFEGFYDLFVEARGHSARSPHSTGGVGMVIFCEEKARRETTAETVSLGLHETMHAWAATYLRRTYDRPLVLPPYVDEGLATYVASLSSPEVAALPARRVAEWRRRGWTPPTLDALRGHDAFYERGEAAANYFLSEQLIERLIGRPEQGATSIRAFLDAYAEAGDDLRAWRAVSGKDAAAEYGALIAGR
jgi:hypothetical protein